MPPESHDAVSTMTLALALARLEVQVQHVREAQEENRQAIVDLKEQLQPVAESVTRWKGALTAISIAAGGVGAVVAMFVKKWIGALPS